MRRLLIGMLCALLSLTGYGQEIRGKVTNKQGTPLPYVNIVALHPRDSTYIQGTVSRDDGSFRLTLSQQPSSVRLKISFIGYTTLYREVKPGNIGTLLLEEEATQLKEVEVKGSLPVSWLKGDRLVTQVKGSLLSKMGNASEMLERIPGLEGKDGKFTVFGKGTPLIYINGRKLRDTSELERINAEDIDYVEIINSPGAEYDASVKAVLNIRLARKQGDGFGMRLNHSLSQTHRTSQNEQISVNYRHGGLDIFGSVYYGDWRDWQDQTNNQTMHADSLWNIFNRLHLESDIHSLNLSGGFDYLLNKNHSIGMNYNGDWSLNSKGGWTSTMNITANSLPYDQVDNLYTQHFSTRPNHSMNAYYRGQINKISISLDADYVENRSANTQVSEEFSQEDNDRTVTSHYEADGKLYATKLVLGYSFGKSTIKWGSEISFTRRKDTYINPEHLLPDNENEIKEDHIAGFASYNLNLKHWNLQAGLRYEHIENRYLANGKQSNEQSHIYNNVFPNLSLSGDIGKVQISFSYTAKTSRPSYSSLNGNIQYNDRFTYQGGNPLLQPTTIHDFTLNAAYHWLNLTTIYTHRKNAVCNNIDFYGNDRKLSIWHPVNVKQRDDFLLMLSASPHIKWWHPNFSTSMIHQMISPWTTNPDKKPYHPRFYFGVQNTFDLPCRFIANVDAMYKTDTYEGRSWRPGYGSIHLGVSKRFLKEDALTIRLRVYDLLKAFRYSANSYSDGISFRSWNYGDSRSITLSVNYRFNTVPSKYKGSGAGNAEKSRL